VVKCSFDALSALSARVPASCAENASGEAAQCRKGRGARDGYVFWRSGGQVYAMLGGAG
jgi:hypothetical protein